MASLNKQIGVEKEKNMALSAPRTTRYWIAALLFFSLLFILYRGWLKNLKLLVLKYLKLFYFL